MDTAFYEGAIAIVPDIANNPTSEQVSRWEQQVPKNYRWTIIDEEADCLNTVVAFKTMGSPKDITIRDLGGERLSFKNNNRPGARYLHFRFVIAVLKTARRRRVRGDPGEKYKPHPGKDWWATQRMYLNPVLLRALARDLSRGIDDIPSLPEPNDNTHRELSDYEATLVIIAQVIAAQKEVDEEEIDRPCTKPTRSLYRGTRPLSCYFHPGI